MFPWLKDSWLKLLKVYNGTHAPNSILIYGKDGLGKKEIAQLSVLPQYGRRYPR